MNAPIMLLVPLLMNIMDMIKLFVTIAIRLAQQIIQFIMTILSIKNLKKWFINILFVVQDAGRRLAEDTALVKLLRTRNFM